MRGSVGGIKECPGKLAQRRHIVDGKTVIEDGRETVELNKWDEMVTDSTPIRLWRIDGLMI